ncbi:flagellar basal-body MS-ring/collar protein FliF [Massilia scottii]|uniref:flagellar basal-body MS-ring/collar protein FliF n=1 Tax=Massilia scottii TaxID=3057166 RepID=UPI0035B602BC
MIASLKSNFAGRMGAMPSLPPALRNNLTPILVLAIAITAAVMMYLWNDQAGYKPVFGASERVASGDMMAVLDADQISYRLHPETGQLLVPSSQLGKVRMLLAAKGLSAQLPAGLELMDKNDPLGVSQFVQDVRFRRGLEGELSQSILALDAIASARVHLSIARSTSFVASDGEKSSASVVIAVKPGRTLAPEQIAAIINMVSGSVASLSPQRVSLVDQAGNYLSSRVDLSDGFDGAGQGADANAKKYQDQVRGNVNELLGPVLGANNFKLSVTADIDNDKIEETSEKYGDAPKVTSEAVREEQEKNRMAMGVPGTLSNRPPALPDPQVAGAGAGASPDPALDDGSARKNASTRQFAYDRNITQIKRSRGRLKKLSVAVVLNNNVAAAKTGWTAAELANIEKTLTSGLGINAERGDVLTVSAMTFPVQPAAAPWWQERDNVVDMSSWAAWAVGILLGFLLIIRPLLRLLTVRLAPAAAVAADAQLLGGPAGAATAVAGPALRAGETRAVELVGGAPALGAPLPMVPLLENYDLPPAGSAVDVMVDHLKVLAAKEPERVAEVVKQWMQKNGRTGQ